MTKHTAIILTPESNFMGEVDSIKLFGSIASALSELDRNDFDKFYNSVSSGETRISSAFPLVGNTYFFPMPIYPSKYDEKLSKSDDIKIFMKIKEIKKTGFVSQKIFEYIINNKPELGKILDKVYNKGWKLNKKYLYSNGEADIKENLIKRHEVPKNILDRYTYRSTIFYSQAYFYNCDLFFLVKTNKEVLKLIKTALKLLEDRGLSQDFSIGFGEFKLKDIREIELDESGNGVVLLSKYHPNEDEVKLIKDSDKSYRIKEIKGFTKNGFHIPAYKFFEEGSYFKLDEIKGGVIDIPHTKTSLNGTAYYVKST